MCFVYFASVIVQQLQETFDVAFTAGGFLRSSAKKQYKELASSGLSQEEEDMMDGLFCCSKEGCVKVYQTHAALENHLHYGTCDLREENALWKGRKSFIITS